MDEFGAGFDTSKKLPKKLKLEAANSKKNGKLSLADRLKMNSKQNNGAGVGVKKLNKRRDMSVFDD